MLTRPVVPPSLSGPACEDVDPGLFFPAPAESDARGKAICIPCPVRRKCYELARARGEEWGIWGGVNFETQARGRKAS
jgi:WhiB family redox-sensing transcriptional regulator